jgi:ketosteroid isomerase-like protein
MSVRRLARFATLLATASLLFLSQLSGAQVPTTPKKADAATLKAIDNDLWIPFAKSYSDLNAEAYIALNSKSVVRVLGDMKFIEPHESFVKSTRQMFDGLKKNKGKVAINWRFNERIHNADTASERGIYEFILTDAAGKQRKSYSRFHVILKKESGKWKIVTDYDSEDGGTINEAAYKAAFARDDYAKF